MTICVATFCPCTLTSNASYFAKIFPLIFKSSLRYLGQWVKSNMILEPKVNDKQCYTTLYSLLYYISLIFINGILECLFTNLLKIFSSPPLIIIIMTYTGSNCFNTSFINGIKQVADFLLQVIFDHECNVICVLEFVLLASRSGLFDFEPTGHIWPAEAYDAARGS